jgi:glutathione S-transferase
MFSWVLSGLELFYRFPYFDLYFVGRPFEVATALACGLLRVMSGEFCAKGLDQCKRPATPLKLYEFEGCPYCRKVREALCVLDLEADIYPCPKPSGNIVRTFGTSGDARFRPRVANPNGKTTFPVLDDAGCVIRGSEEIVAHLWSRYGDKATPPLNYRIGRFLDKTPAFILPSFFRLHPRHGIMRRPSRAPAKPLILHGFEPSPFVKLVREALSSFEIPYRLVPMPHGSSKREAWAEMYGGDMRQAALRSAVGAIQVPMLIDPNGTNKPIFESADIIAYIEKTYGASPCADKKA